MQTPDAGKHLGEDGISYSIEPGGNTGAALLIAAYYDDERLLETTVTGLTLGKDTDRVDPTAGGLLEGSLVFDERSPCCSL